MRGLTGAISCYRVDSHISDRIKHHTPFGTLFVNLSGSFAIGFMYQLFKHPTLGSDFKIFIITSFLGAFSTFSSYPLHTLKLLEDEKYKASFINLLLTNILGILMVFLGTLAGNLIK